MERFQQEEEGKDSDQQAQYASAEVPDLAMTLQAMSLAEPGLCRLQNNQEMQQQDLDFSFCLLMKIACTGGTPRNISQQSVEQAMLRAWGDRFYAISQVSKSVFMAHFRSQEDMLSVYTRQPWVMNTETLLLEWFDPNDNANSSSDYKFDHIFVTVRAYGIPRDRRSQVLLLDILNQVGLASDFHIRQDSNLFAKQDYIWGVAKLKVSNPVKDRAIVPYADNSTGLAYLHYEKIRRICLFCGVMFHTVQNCSFRTNLIAEISRSRQAGPDIPVQRFGQWIIDEKHIPPEVIQSTRTGSTGGNQPGNAILGRLQRLFAEDPKGKRKVTAVEEQKNRTNSRNQGQIHLSSAAVNIGQATTTWGNSLHNSHNIVHPSFGQHNGERGDAHLHGRHLSLPPSTTQQRRQPFNESERVVEGTSVRREEAATQTHSEILCLDMGTRITTGETAAEEPNSTSSPSLPMEETTNIQHRPLLGQENCPNLTPQTAPLSTHVQQEGLPIVSSSTPDISGHQNYPSPSLPNEHASSSSQFHTHQTSCSLLPNAPPMQRPPPKRPFPTSSPNSSPLAKRSTPAIGFGGQYNPVTAAHLPPGVAIGAGILGVGPRGGTEADQGTTSTQARDPARPSFRTNTTAAEGRSRRRPSGWDVEISPQSGAHNASSTGITFYQPGSATWQRIEGADTRGQGGPLRRSRSNTIGPMVHPYSPSPRRSPARASSGMAGDHSFYPPRLASPSYSVGTQDSSYEALSPTQMATDYYMSPVVAHGIADQGGQEEVRPEAQSQIDYAHTQDSQQVDCLQDGSRRDVEMDHKASAPASKAPRAP